MVNLKETEQKIRKTAATFLAEKPLWVWILTYALLTIVLFFVFMIFFTIFNELKWYLLVLLVIAGAVWGAVKHSQANPPAPPASPASPQD